MPPWIPLCLTDEEKALPFRAKFFQPKSNSSVRTKERDMLPPRSAKPTALFYNSQSEKFCLTVQTCAISPAEWQLGNNLQIGMSKGYQWLMLPLSGFLLRNHLDLALEIFKVRCSHPGTLPWTHWCDLW